MGAATAVAAPAIAKSGGDWTAKARALHQRLLCLDTHLDTPAVFPRPGWDIMQRHAYETGLSQVDYPRMNAGGLDGGFFAIYTGQAELTDEKMWAARDAALLRAAVIREMVAKNAAHFELAFQAADAARINATGKKIVYQSIENAYPLGNDVTLLRSFYALGVRLCGVAHFKNNQFGDSATDPGGKQWNGLSPKGRELLALMNDLGVVPDQSHSSDEVFDEMVKLSKTPIALSHSGCRAVHDNPRNIDDARLKTLAESGGVIQINSLSAYLVTVPKNEARETAMNAVYGKLRTALPGLTAAQATAAVADAGKQIRAIAAQYPQPRASFEDYMQHMLHALNVAGVEHVGVGADWDGGGGVTGMEDVADNWKITARLLKHGYKEADLQKIWSGNILRVLKAAEDGRSASSGGG